MGDVIHALPVLHDIQTFDSSILIDWMVEEPFADLVRANPRVNQVVLVNLRKWRKLGIAHTWQEWKKLKAFLADREYDLIIDLQGLIKSALLACAANGPKAGPAWGAARESVACLFYSQRAAWDPQAHAVERLRQLVANLMNYHLVGPPVFYNPPVKKNVKLADSEHDRYLPDQSRSARGEIWFLHASARDEKKWPIVNWRELAHRFSDLGYTIKLPWGSDAERKQAEQIAQGIAHVEVLDHMSLKLLQQKIQHACLVIGIDTGITHLAAALCLPMVALFFATPAWRFAPRFNSNAISLGDLDRVPCVAEVFEAGSRLLRGNKL